MKKSLLILAAIALVVGGATSVSAQTVAELQAQITALLAQVSALSGTQTSTTVTTTFDRNLTVGSRGADVTSLQQILIDGGFLDIAAPTDYFGALTKAAVIAYQKENAITPAVGYVGPITRAALNAQNNTSVTVTTPGVSTVPGCAAGAAFSATTGASCTAVSTVPGCAVGAAFSATTGASCTTGTTVTTTAGAAEGSFNARIAANPTNSTNVTAGTDKAVYGIEIEAKDSDMVVDRLDLQALVKKVSSSGTEINPANFITNIKIYDGSTLLTEKSVTTSDFDKDSGIYHTRITGINFKVTAGARKVMTVKIDTQTGLDTARYLKVQVYATDGIRAVDTLGLQSYDGLTDTREFTFKTGGDSTLTITTASANPDAQPIAVDDDNGVDGVTMLVVNAKSTVGPSIITDVAVNNISSIATSAPSSIELWVDGALVDSRAVSNGATTTFSDLSINVAKDVTKVLTFKANFPALARGTAVLNIDPVNSFYETPDASQAAFSGSLIASQTVTLFGKVANVALTSASAPTKVTHPVTGTTSEMTGTIKLSITGMGGDLVEPVVGDFVVKAATSSARTNAITVSNLGFVVTPNNSNDLVAEGVAANVTLTPTLTNAEVAIDGNYFFYVESVKWTISGMSQVTQQTGLEDFQTTSLFFDK